MSLDSTDKFTRMVHYFIWRGRSIPTIGKTVLYKLCYFSDFDFYEMNERSITGSRYRKLERGPAPFSFDAAIRDLKKAGSVEEGEAVLGEYKQFKYASLKEPDTSLFSEEELEVIAWEFERFGRWTANALSEFSHKDVPWIIADDNGEISYEAVFYRDPVTSVLDDEGGSAEGE